MNNKKLLGKRIKELRKNYGLTQEKLAELIGIETTSLSGIESGRHFPSMPTVEKISVCLKVEMKSLFDFNHLQDENILKQSIINNVNKLDFKSLSLLYRLLNEKNL